MAVIKSIHKRYRKLAIKSRWNKDKNRKAHINENFKNLTIMINKITVFRMNDSVRKLYFKGMVTLPND
jgi:hypothetical protein